jgi:hypothetical protein
MKTFKQLMREFGNMAIDITKARKNKIFKRDEEEAEKILFALIRDGYTNITWDVSSDGWELMTQNDRGKVEYWNGQTPLETLEQAKKKLRIKL